MNFIASKETFKYRERNRERGDQRDRQGQVDQKEKDHSSREIEEFVLC